MGFMLFLLSILPLKDGIRTKKKSLFYYVVFVIVCFRISCLVEHVQQEHRDEVCEHLQICLRGKRHRCVYCCHHSQMIFRVIKCKYRPYIMYNDIQKRLSRLPQGAA